MSDATPTTPAAPEGFVAKIEAEVAHVVDEVREVLTPAAQTAATEDLANAGLDVAQNVPADPAPLETPPAPFDAHTQPSAPPVGSALAAPPTAEATPVAAEAPVTGGADTPPVDPPAAPPAEPDVPAVVAPPAQVTAPDEVPPGAITHVIPTGLFSDSRERDAFEATGQRGLVTAGSVNPVAQKIAELESALAQSKVFHALATDALAALKLLL